MDAVDLCCFETPGSFHLGPRGTVEPWSEANQWMKRYLGDRCPPVKSDVPVVGPSCHPARNRFQVFLDLEENFLKERWDAASIYFEAAQGRHASSFNLAERVLARVA